MDSATGRIIGDRTDIEATDSEDSDNFETENSELNNTDLGVSVLKPFNMEIQILKRKLAATKGSLTKIYNWILSEEEDSVSLVALNSKYNNIKPLLEKFEGLYFQIVKLQIENKEETLAESEFGEFEDKYYYTETLILSKLESLKNQVEKKEKTENAEYRKVNIKLPTLNINKFGGKNEDWLSFYEVFKCVIHDDDRLKDIQKFHCLISYLENEAAQVIDGITISDDNYKFAWDKLVEHYKNNKLLTETHIANLFDCKKLESQSAKGLRELYNTVLKNVNALKKLEVDNLENCVFLVYLITSKFDKVTSKKWEEETAADKEMPSYQILKEFIVKQYNYLESYEKKNNSEIKLQNKSVKRSTTLVTKAYNNNNSRCKICEINDHPVFRCRKFLNESVDNRRNFVSKIGCCWQCLGYDHKVDTCTGRCCSKCNKRHNYLLCKEPKKSDLTNKVEPRKNDAAKTGDSSTNFKNTVTVCASKFQNKGNISSSIEFKNKINDVALFPTVSILVRTNSGDNVLGRFLLDSASEMNFISETFARKLNVKICKEKLKISGIGCLKTYSAGFVTIKVMSRTTEYDKAIKCYVLPEIISGNTLDSLNSEVLEQLPSEITTNLADKGNSSLGIDGILGVEIFFEVFQGKKFFPAKTNDGSYLILTLFGWVGVGKTTTQIYTNEGCKNYCMTVTDESEFELENNNSLNVITKRRKQEDIICEQHFKDTTTLAKDGRYVVSLPFKTSPECLGNSFDGARKRFLSLEMKFARNPKLKDEYSNFIKEYISMGHMKKIPQDEIVASGNYYLPHHAVYKESSTTSLRVVFNAAYKTDNKISLNDILMVGPALQNDIVAILIPFRFYKYGLTADVAKMYRQIWMDDKDTNFQRIIWRDKCDDELEHYKLMTVTYGTAPAPFLAIRCLHEIAKTIATSQPEIADILKRRFFMDDVVTGADTLDKLKALQQILQEVLNKRGLFLRKWCANSVEFLETLPQIENEKHYCVKLDDKETIKALGIEWNPKVDKLIFKISGWRSNKITKRTILADIHSFWDPIGLLAPILIKGKMFLQELWRIAVSWDEEVPEEIRTKWLKFRGSLEKVGKINIPRRVTVDDCDMEVHGFSDSSEKAYGACVYVRSKGSEGTITTRLLMAKARVCPLNKLSIARCELLGAVLLVKLLMNITENVKLSSNKIHCWTDSEIVLAWINGSPQQWKTFVAQRVASIREITKPEQWHYIQSKGNPADILSRGVKAFEFEKNKLWWEGPEILKLENWPVWKDDSGDIPEKKKMVYSLTVSTKENDMINRYSSWTKLIRITAYLLRFSWNCTHLNDRKSSELTIEEIHEAKLKIIRQIQEYEFQEEVNRLKDNKQLKRKSNLLSLHTIMDHNGLLRVGGRLEHAKISEERKHPIILPYKHKVTQLILEDFHRKHCHVGPMALLTLVRGEYWPINGKSAAKAIVHGCVTCRKALPKFLEPLMAALPKERVNPTRCFAITGVDFCGPIWLKVGMRKSVKQKAYIAVFVCFAVKAIHVELVTDLSSKAFLAALKRFFARRGLSEHLYSDNGTNFVGASKELAAIIKDPKVKRECIELGVRWHFIPPAAPHFGGIWEASVKLVKGLMVKTMGNQVLNYEEATTLLTGIEACLNSRPLTPISDSPTDFSALTPAHFLVGGPLHLPPECEFSDAKPLVDRWKRVQQLGQLFWKRWSSEYLSGLQQRTKWRFKSCGIPIGTLVTIKEDNLKPTQWRLARVVDLHPGLDGIVRVASVKIASGLVMKRPIIKLCPILDI